MTDAVWQLENNHARLRREPFSARLDLLRPAEGLCQVGPEPAVFADAKLLGVEILSCVSGGTQPAIERHVRGDDLVVTYPESEAWQVHVDVLWRSPSLTQPDGVLAAVELIVSVRTQLLDSRPALRARSVLAADEMLRLADASANRFRPLVPKHTSRLGPAEGPGCLLFRRSGGRMSYAEMIHPADFHRDDLSGGVPGDPPLQVRHRLFPQGLEKGVILRARLRGIFCPRQDDTRIVADAYRAFASADPPLGS